MSVLLTADEAARLRSGEQLVIVRAGKHLNLIAEGRQIVPLYTECPDFTPRFGERAGGSCSRCEGTGRVLMGRGSIEVVPVVADLEDVCDAYEGPSCIEVNPATGYCRLWPAWSGALEDDDGFDVDLMPNALPVPGRDFGIVIDCVEVAS